MATTVFTFPISNFGPGSQTLPSKAVPDADSQVTLALDRSTMTDPALVVDLTIDFSPDGGVTWASTSPGPEMGGFPAGAEILGGTFFNKDGSVATTSSRIFPFPAGTNRMVRGNVVVSGAPLTTTATLTLA